MNKINIDAPCSEIERAMECEFSHKSIDKKNQIIFLIYILMIQSNHYQFI